MKSDTSKPCKGCTKETGRFPGCHATCPKWKAAEKVKKERREAERKENIVRSYIADEVKKAKRSGRAKNTAGGDFNG